MRTPWQWRIRKHKKILNKRKWYEYTISAFIAKTELNKLTKSLPKTAKVAVRDRSKLYMGFRKILSNMKILIVEDERGIIETLEYAFSKEGFEHSAVETANSALKELKENIYNFVILDIGLPDINGIELCKQIRAFSNIPIIFLTARSEEIDKILGLEIGADDYVTKPFSPRELVARIKTISKRLSNSSSSKLQPSIEDGKLPTNFPFINDKNRCEISYYSQTLDLSAHEYKILALLIKNPGWVYSRFKILNLAWEEPSMVTERTVDTHIKSIRKKLEAIKANSNAIVTHRSIGYSIKENGKNKQKNYTFIPYYNTYWLWFFC